MLNINYNFNSEETKLIENLRKRNFIFIIGQGGTASRFVSEIVKKMNVYIGYGNTINNENDSLLFNKYYEKIKNTINSDKLYVNEINDYIMKELLNFFKDYYDDFDANHNIMKNNIYQGIKLNSIVYFIEFLKIIIPDSKIIYIKRDFMYLTKKNSTYGRNNFPLDCLYLAKIINLDNTLVSVSSTNLEEKNKWREYEYEYMKQITKENMYIFDTDKYINNEEEHIEKLHKYLNIPFDKKFITQNEYLDETRYYKV